MIDIGEECFEEKSFKYFLGVVVLGFYKCKINWEKWVK